MRVIALKRLQDFWKQERYRNSEQPLRAWYQIAIDADWARPSDIKAQFRNASFLKDNRVVFNIHGNSYRLIVPAYYPHRNLLIKFIGTHRQYERINPETVGS